MNAYQIIYMLVKLYPIKKEWIPLHDFIKWN